MGFCFQVYVTAKHEGTDYIMALLLGYRDPPAGVAALAGFAMFFRMRIAQSNFAEPSNFADIWPEFSRISEASSIVFHRATISSGQW